ncbi:(deoxy)nucleoside triphosphate pyrophosphohydrolase [Mucilaginibacter sp. ZT4R22]|uniref:8-oxo-dGTP diphosphatase n=1 Tax=Mucilaginibacter pankratovii TaxID=2772110 RepID=A0ABR7WQX7_9SPHI|nr:(deoxy)nucleoside triphosphate pyrophosphohydrolase [Mucilaginibacter pankratovii]MBD1364721.1 (deoxy)nucleoside triphosphate pyrophosphohydrolase [Mucilaginibacter pankratovii]
MIQVTCALIVDDQNRLFAAQRSESMNLPLKWEFPGGKIEPDETTQECLIREIFEELNITIKIVKDLPTNIHNYPTFAIALIPFVCNYVSGELILKEHAQFKWLHKNELLDLDWAEADIPILHHYLNLINAKS